MKKYILIILTTVWMSVAAAHTERDYMLHPTWLQKAIEQCPEKQPREVSCEQLKQVASQVNDLAYELRMSPQLYGKKILALQSLIATQENHVQEHPNEGTIQSQLIENKKSLQERLAIVKWLESPVS